METNSFILTKKIFQFLCYLIATTSISILFISGIGNIIQTFEQGRDKDRLEEEKVNSDNDLDNPFYSYNHKTDPPWKDGGKPINNWNSGLNDTNNCLTGHEADFWYLGANGIKWVNDSPTIVSGLGGVIGEVMSSICDKDGNLLLYSDGYWIFNKYNEIVLRIGSLYGSASSSMFLILPQPGNDSLYYIFQPPENHYQLPHPHKMYYSVINVKANAGHCSIVKANKLLLVNSSEKICGIRHCNGKDWWVVGLRSTDEAFHSWLLSDTGITVNTPVISYSGKLHRESSFEEENRGWLKPNNIGSVIGDITTQASGASYCTLEMHKFNNSNGVVFFGFDLISEEDKFFTLYSCEFSPDQTKIYITGNSKRNRYDLYQMDVSVLDSATIRNSFYEVAATNNNIGSPILGPDGKIYITNFNSIPFLHVIHNPNRSGAACDFRLFEFSLGAPTSLGAPLFAAGLQFPYVLSISGPRSICNDTTVRYIVHDPCPHPSVSWTLYNGGSVMRQAGDTLEVYYQNIGKYRIAASYLTDCGAKSDTVDMEVKGCSCNVAFNWIQEDHEVCAGTDVKLTYQSNSSDISINGIKQMSDSIVLKNLLHDTCFNLILKYPKFCDTSFNYCISVKKTYYKDTVYTICPNDSVKIQSTWFKKDTTFALYNLSSELCDSVTNIKVIRNNLINTRINVQACDGDTLVVNGRKILSNQTIDTVLQSKSGCLDSLVTIEYKFNTLPKINIINLQACYGDSVQVKNKWYINSSVIYDTISSSAKCDSITEYHVIIHNKVSDKYLSYYPCYNQPIAIKIRTGTITITKDTIVIERLTNMNGCDSIINHIVSFGKKIDSSTSFWKCKEKSIVVNNKEYKNSGTFEDTLQATDGCDSLIYLEINEYPASIEKEINYYVCSGDSLLVNNSWYNNDTTIFLNLQNSNGCDSLVKMKIILSEKIVSRQQILLCKGDSIFYSGKYYRDSITLFNKFKSIYGCDSTNIFQILIKGTNDKTSDLIKICQGDTIEIDNIKYFNNEVVHKKYSNLLGCDSIHSTIIEVLEKVDPKLVFIDFCRGDSIYYNDRWHFSPTNYIIKKNRVSQCDSFDQVIIEWFPEPDFDLLHTISLTEDEVTTINIGDQNKIQSIQWRPSTYLNCNDCINPEITAKEDITYYLTITDLNGCTYKDSISIKVIKKSTKIWFPTAFSPNNDHVNDDWRPVLNNSNESIEQISIFDRWGSKVYSSNSNEGWDGMVHNKLALPGVYVFYVSWRDENGNLKVSQGDITLVR